MIDKIFPFETPTACKRSSTTSRVNPSLTSKFSIYGESERNNAVKRIVKKFIEDGKLSDAEDWEKKVNYDGFAYYIPFYQ